MPVKKPLPTSILLPLSLADRLRVYCFQKRLTRSQVVRAALEQYLNRKEGKK